MTRIRNVAGAGKWLLNQQVKLGVFLHFLPDLFRGRTSVRHFVAFLRRLLYFLAKLQHNKFVKIGKNTRFNLYVPGYPSRPFFTACQKFATFGEKLSNTTVLVSITSACRFKCEHCYQRHDLGKDSDIEKLLPVLRRLQDLGVAFFNVEGGDPFLVYEKLKRVCEAIDSRSEIWVNSTGDGMTAPRLRELNGLGLTAIMFSLHTPDPTELDAFMGADTAWATMVEGVRLCHQEGVPVAFNTCLTRESFYNGTFDRIMERAKEFGACMVQLIKPKPAGAWLELSPEKFSDSDLKTVRALVDKYNHSRKYRHYPSISAQIMEEDRCMFGCTAGGTDRFYINAKGDVQPCEFLNLSFGNIVEEDFDAIYARMRELFRDPRDAWLCEKYAARILEIKATRKVDRLPLGPALSEGVYASWDRGEKTELYRRLEEIN